MTTPASSSTTVTPTAQQLVYATTNVYNHFSFKLTADGPNYKLWRRIFLDLCRGAKVMGHINGKSAPTGDDDDDWYSIDSRVKSWFYSTCDSNILKIISSDDCTAKDLWDSLEEFFLNNKMSRMLTLQDQFRNTKKGATSITEFCHTLKNLADALADVDCEISEMELVMQIIRQIPPSYNSIVSVITNKDPFPSFLTAKNMLLLHEAREESVDASNDNTNSTTTALYSVNTNPGKQKNNRWNKNRNNGTQPTSQSQFAGILGTTPTASSQQQLEAINQQGHLLQKNLVTPQKYAAMLQQYHGHPVAAYSMQQPFPLPLQPFGVQPSLIRPIGQASSSLSQAPSPAANQINPLGSFSHPPAPLGSVNNHQPATFFGGQGPATQPQFTDLSSVFQAMSVQPPQDNNYYMDTGANSHMSFNQGS